MAEWVALWLEVGYRHAPQVLREDGHNWGPVPEGGRAYVDAHIALAQLDKRILDADFARLTGPAKPTDTDLDGLVHIEEVAHRLGRSRRTVEFRLDDRDRRVDRVKVAGKTYIRTEDIERLRDE